MRYFSYLVNATIRYLIPRQRRKARVPICCSIALLSSAWVFIFSLFFVPPLFFLLFLFLLTLAVIHIDSFCGVIRLECGQRDYCVKLLGLVGELQREVDGMRDVKLRNTSSPSLPLLFQEILDG